MDNCYGYKDAPCITWLKGHFYHVEILQLHTVMYLVRHATYIEVIVCVYILHLQMRLRAERDIVSRPTQ